VTFSSRDLTPAALRCVVEYVYTRTATTLDAANAVDVIAAADRFDLARLSSLAELCLCKAVDRAVSDSIARADVDCVGLLLFARRHRADLLATFLLHFIATNYGVFADADLQRLRAALPDDFTYVQTNQWPPRSYLEALDAWHARSAAAKTAPTSSPLRQLLFGGAASSSKK